ncbi:MAG: long-chain fatty acid--CoA ligase [Bacteroidota bacterium]
MKPSRLFDFIYYQKEHFPQAISYAGKTESGEWKHYSTDDMIEQSLKMAGGLLDLGLEAGDKIAIVSYKNRPEWTIADLAAMQVGVIDVPLYPTISSGEYEYILNDAEVKYAFVGGGDSYDKVLEAQKNVPSLKGIFTFDPQEGRPHWEEMWKESRIEEVKTISEGIKSSELATLIYTSGTTGNPKGVMLTHDNIAHVTYVSADALPINTGDSVLSFLPLCHIFERAASYSFAYKGASIYYTGTDNLGGETGDLRSVEPHYFNTVPRLLEKVYEAIYNKGLELSGVKKKLFFWALSLTDDFEYDKTYGGMDGFKRKIADKLIFSKWREALGGNIKGILTGAAPCPPKILRVFSAAGIPIREAYGLTETSPGLTYNQFKGNHALVGTVGIPFDKVEIQIDTSEGEYKEGEGEILAAGPNIMQGYYNKPDKTAEVFKEIDGKTWFRTGDIGKMIPHRGADFLKITDRKKELLKTSGGKYVAPAPIEGRFKEDFLIEQMMVIGDKQKFVSALMVPATEALKDWCKNNDVAWTTRAEVLQNPKVIARYQQIVDECNPQFSHIEQIKKFALLDAEWEPTKEDGSDAELTPTMKLKRRVIREKFAKEIASMYE